ncbi:unnamed protein product, partial [Vitis vinifera]|uniref:Uncharacterized protein n=1 Tax=Vitis vinifera TaxID=29760 RepID=D7U7S4_VITVI
MSTVFNFLNKTPFGLLQEAELPLSHPLEWLEIRLVLAQWQWHLILV